VVVAKDGVAGFLGDGVEHVDDVKKEKGMGAQRAQMRRKIETHLEVDGAQARRRLLHHLGHGSTGSSIY
jgi:hypothetical protein